MDDTLLCQLTSQLSLHNLTFLDLPRDETLLYDTMGELGFDSFIARAMLRKMINLEYEYGNSHGVATINKVQTVEVMSKQQQPRYGQLHPNSNKTSALGHKKKTQLQDDGPDTNTPTNDVFGLSEAGLKGLIVARRAALEMAAAACTERRDVESWFLVPKDLQTSQEARRYMPW